MSSNERGNFVSEKRNFENMIKTPATTLFQLRQISGLLIISLFAGK